VSVDAVSLVSDRYQSTDGSPFYLKLYVGGVRRTAEGIQGTFEWREWQLKAGDKATIRVVDVDEADISPLGRERTMAEVTESAEREELAHLFRKYGGS
jgi:hypothetical protein